MYEAYPLQWPAGYKRTAQRKGSIFKQTAEAAQTFLRNEIIRMGGTGLIVSSNVVVRKDNYMYSDMCSSKIEDPGIAIYFKYKGKQISMCCDQYERPWENIYALGKGIEALRGMERWGVSEFMERAFTGFTALPESSAAVADIWEVLGLNIKPANEFAVIEAYRAKAKICHPDVSGGSTEKFQQLQAAYEKALSFYN